MTTASVREKASAVNSAVFPYYFKDKTAMIQPHFFRASTLVIMFVLPLLMKYFTEGIFVFL